MQDISPGPQDVHNRGVPQHRHFLANILAYKKNAVRKDLQTQGGWN